MSISEAKSSIPITEAMRWVEFGFEEEWSTVTKTDWYLARITYYLYLLTFILGGKPEKELKDFLIKFDAADKKKGEGETPEEPILYEDEREAIRKRALASRRAWLAAAGVNTGNKPKTPVKAKKKLPDKVVQVAKAEPTPIAAKPAPLKRPGKRL